MHVSQSHHNNHRPVSNACVTVTSQESLVYTQRMCCSLPTTITGLYTCMSQSDLTVIPQESLSVIKQSSIFHRVTLCHHASVLHFHIRTASLCHHTVLDLPIHRVSLSAIAQSSIFPFMHRHSVIKQSFIFLFTQCRSLSSHSLHSSTVSFVITQSFIFPVAQCHSLSSHSHHIHTASLCRHIVLHLPIHAVPLLSSP